MVILQTGGGTCSRIRRRRLFQLLAVRNSDGPELWTVLSQVGVDTILKSVSEKANDFDVSNQQLNE
ncbi:hypothetical protein INR49_022933 [Caranx melampygus]|nr:hypothetical protein INR49_005172 [Caranx melampygus]KAG7245282.1 hypothetical protein INR49_022933 [Caranx melampygus]